MPKRSSGQTTCSAKKRVKKLVIIRVREPLSDQDYRTLTFVVSQDTTVAQLKAMVSHECQNHVILPAAAQRIMLNKVELQDGQKLWGMVEAGQEIKLLAKEEIPVTMELNGITLEHDVYDYTTVLELKTLLQQEYYIPLQYQFIKYLKVGVWKQADDQSLMKDLIDNRKISLTVLHRPYQANIKVYNNFTTPFSVHVEDVRNATVMNIKEMIVSEYRIPMGDQTIYQHGTPLGDDLSLHGLSLVPHGRLYLCIDPGQVQEARPRTAFLIMDCTCIQLIQACFIDGKVFVEFGKRSIQACIHQNGSGPASPVVETTTNFQSRPFDVDTCSFSSSSINADNPSDSDATGLYVSSGIYHSPSGHSWSDYQNMNPSFSDLEVATHQHQFYLGDNAGPSNQHRFALEEDGCEKVSMPKRRGTLTEGFGLDSSNSTQPKRMVEHSADQSSWGDLHGSRSTAINLDERNFLRMERGTSTEGNGQGHLWREIPGASKSASDSRLQRARSSSPPVTQSPSTPDTPNTMKFCSVGKSLIDAFETPRQKQDREFPIQGKMKPKQPIQISESEGSTDDSRHTLFSLIPGAVSEPPIRSLDSAIRRRQSRPSTSRRQGQGLADFLQLSDQTGSPAPAPSSGYGTQKYLQNTD